MTRVPTGETPPEGKYVTTSWWHAQERDAWEAERGLPAYQWEPLVSAHDDLAAAEVQGQRDGCMNGIRRVEVRGPDGTLHALWDKESLVTTKTRRYVYRGRMIYDVDHKNNQWQRISEESKELSRRNIEEILSTRRTLRAELGREPTSIQTVERMRRDRAAREAAGA